MFFKSGNKIERFKKAKLFLNVMITKDVSKKVDKEYNEIASKYPASRERISKESLLWFQNLKNGLIEKIKNSESKLKEAYKWRLTLIAQDFSDAVDLVNEVWPISNIYKPSMSLISYIPFTSEYCKRKEVEKNREELKRQSQIVPDFERELQDIRKYIKYKTLSDIKLGL